MPAGALRVEKSSSERSGSPNRTPRPAVSAQPGSRLSTLAPAVSEVAVREVMDIRQAACYLGISTDSLYRYAAENVVPGFRLGNRWRFKKSRLDQWMEEQSNPHPAGKTGRPQQKKPVRSAR